jgi:hypothetical protein
MTASDIFIQHTEDIVAVARRLLSRNITVYAHECSNVHFGRWLVVTGRDLERFQFDWDGRTFTLTISQSALVEGRREWKPFHTLNVRHTQAVSAIETFLHEHFTRTS